MSITVFQAQQEGEGAAGWVRADMPDKGWPGLPDFPGPVSVGGDDFVVAPPPSEGAAYVNGVQVVLMQALEAGDLIYLVSAEGIEFDGVYAGCRGAVELQEGGGRPCAFTGQPIDGKAVVCRQCSVVVSAAVAESLENCRCGRPLTCSVSELPGKELL